MKNNHSLVDSRILVARDKFHYSFREQPGRRERQILFPGHTQKNDCARWRCSCRPGKNIVWKDHSLQRSHADHLPCRKERSCESPVSPQFLLKTVPYLIV